MPGSWFHSSIVLTTAILSSTSVGVAIMAFGAGGCKQRFGMTGPASAAAMVHAAPALICDPRVGTAVSCRPIVNRVAGNTIQSKQSGMIGRVSMTTRTHRG
jgi:hypothetical protein